MENGGAKAQGGAVNRDRLTAFADGELSPEEAAAVVMHLADHPEDQAFVDEVMAANAALVRAFSAPMAEPVPDRIRRTIEGAPPQGLARVLPFRRRDPQGPVPYAVGGMVLAASVAVAAFLIPGSVSRDLLPVGRLAADSELARALATLPTGGDGRLDDGRAITVLATMPVEGGHCREVEVIDRPGGTLSVALACTDAPEAGDAGWSIRVAMTEPLPGDVSADGFVPAGGIETDAILPWLDHLQAGPALAPAEEAALIADGWGMGAGR